jgi:hypothetical protein
LKFNDKLIFFIYIYTKIYEYFLCTQNFYEKSLEINTNSELKRQKS